MNVTWCFLRVESDVSHRLRWRCFRRKRPVHTQGTVTPPDSCLPKSILAAFANGNGGVAVDKGVVGDGEEEGPIVGRRFGAVLRPLARVID